MQHEASDVDLMLELDQAWPDLIEDPGALEDDNHLEPDCHDFDLVFGSTGFDDDDADARRHPVHGTGPRRTGERGEKGPGPSPARPEDAGTTRYRK